MNALRRVLSVPIWSYSKCPETLLRRRYEQYRRITLAWCAFSTTAISVIVEWLFMETVWGADSSILPGVVAPVFSVLCFVAAFVLTPLMVLAIPLLPGIERTLEERGAAPPRARFDKTFIPRIAMKVCTMVSALLIVAHLACP